MWHDSVCNTVQEPTVTSTIVAKKTAAWRESGFPSEFLGDAEFPGMWGLPAASCRHDETPEQAAQRVGAGKLGVPLVLEDVLAQGQQPRTGYLLKMTLFRARLVGQEPELPSGDLETGDSGAGGFTLYTGWRWGDPGDLLGSAQKGSLCSQLLLGTI